MWYKHEEVRFHPFDYSTKHAQRSGGIMTAKIEKIEIKINDHVISLSIEEAKELKEALSSMFREPGITPYPVFIERLYYYYRWWTGTCQSETVTLSLQA